MAPPSHPGIPSFFGFQPWFYLFASCEAFEHSLSLSSEGIQEIPLLRICDRTCWLFRHSLCPLFTQGKSHLTRNTAHFSAGMFSSDLQQLPLVFWLLFGVM